MIHNVIHGAV